MKQQEQVKDFFDGHAPNYKQKYTKQDTYYDYFFYERLAAATQNISFAQKSILDIGTGTGALYDYLCQIEPADFEFGSVCSVAALDAALFSPPHQANRAHHSPVDHNADRSAHGRDQGWPRAG